MSEGFVLDSLSRYIGQTVTIFTTSGGLSGSGFTGVLAGIGNCTVKLITDVGAAPACPVGSSCGNSGGCGCGCGGRCGGRGLFSGFGNGLGNYGFFGNGGGYGGYGGYGSYGGYGGYNWLGSVTEIPIDRIASFTHNAI